MLIKCPECGKEVSSEANACPFCGYPIKQLTSNQEPQPYEKYSEEEIRKFAKDAKEYYSASKGCIGVGLLMFIGGLIAVILAFALYDLDYDAEIIMYVLGGIIGDIGFLIMTIGGGVNNTKGNNRFKIVEEYKTRHPDFKEDE